MDGLKIQNPLVNGGGQSGGITAPNKNILKNLEGVQGPSFGETLKTAIEKVNDLQQTADIKMQQLATGETTDIADVKIAAEKADIALRLMTSIRNKMIDAYNEIMKMQV